MTDLTAQAEVNAASTGAEYFRPRRLGHVNLWVEDLNASERFYSEVCGLNVEFTEPDLVATFLGTGHTPHDLGMMETTKGKDRYGRNGLLQLPGTIGLKSGLNHLAWELENEAELVQAWKNLQRTDTAIDMTVDHQVAHSVYIFDPDGNYNEFYCDTVKDWRNVLKGEMELITSHWDPAQEEQPFTEGRYDEQPTLRHVEEAPIHPYRITHLVLQTPRMSEMLDFYCRIGGLTVVDRQDGAVYLRSALTQYEFSLVLVDNDTAAYHHASFELKDEAELEASLERLKAAGRAPKHQVDLPWKRAFFMEDVDGLLSEWYVTRGAKRDLSQRGNVPLSLAV